MELTIGQEIGSFLKLGAIQFSGQTVSPSGDEFWTYAEEVFANLTAKFVGVPTGQIQELQDVRGFYHAAGMDPTKHRPSCEALLRRLLQGKGLYRVNNAVDCMNVWSLRLFIPACVHDADRIEGNVRVRLGAAGESYLGIDGKKEVSLTNLPVLSDELGPFGNPSADSDRTKVTNLTKSVLLILYIPLTRSEAWCREALDHVATDFERWCGGNTLDARVVTAQCP
jgi:DNA/RNA-binding domain of Phe-tRNA-synthetase-like protein